MGWNWIKITGLKDLPPFNKSVMLYEYRDGREYAMVGCLKSIDADGYHWGTSNTQLFDISAIFNLKLEKKDEFKPTHWCEIERPLKEKE